jgi:hypothetical protein
MIMSLDRDGSPSNYHWPTDTADRVDYDSVAATVRVCEKVVRWLAADGLAARPPGGPSADLG